MATENIIYHRKTRQKKTKLHFSYCQSDNTSAVVEDPADGYEVS